MISREQAERLEARDQAGEDLTAAEWGDLSVYHADLAIYHAEKGARLSRIAMVLAVLGAACAVLSFVLAMVS